MHVSSLQRLVPESQSKDSGMPVQQRASWLGPWPRCATPAKPSSAAAMEPSVTAMCSLASPAIIHHTSLAAANAWSHQLVPQARALPVHIVKQLQDGRPLPP